MTSRPIIFSGPMVRAILDGKKTVTRRRTKAIRDLPTIGEVHQLSGSTYSWMRCDDWNEPRRFRPTGPVWAVRDFIMRRNGGEGVDIHCPYGAPGDTLWVRETFCLVGDGINCYRASDDPVPDGTKWKPAIHMPRDLSRISLRIFDTSLIPLGDIDEPDLQREGFTGVDARDRFFETWRALNGSCTGHEFVWRIEFRSELP